MSLLAMAFAIITQKAGDGGGGRFILILNSLVTRLYNNVLGFKLNRSPDRSGGEGREEEKKHLYNISY